MAVATVFGVAAQETEFTADRPGASTGPSVVGHKVIQLEQGVQYDGDGGKGQFTFSSTQTAADKHGKIDQIKVPAAAEHQPEKE